MQSEGCGGRGEITLGVAAKAAGPYDERMNAAAGQRKLGLVHRASGRAGRVEQLGPYGIETLIEREEEGAATAYRVCVAPRERTRVSYHRIAEEFYFVLGGRGTAILDGRERAIAAGDFLRLPPGTTHGFVAADEPLDMLNIHTPGCRPDRDVYFPDGPAPEGFRTSEEGRTAS